MAAAAVPKPGRGGGAMARGEGKKAATGEEEEGQTGECNDQAGREIEDDCRTLD